MLRYVICGFNEKGVGWFRILGYGLYYKDIRIHPKSFSERTGFRKTIQLGTILIGTLVK